MLLSTTPDQLPSVSKHATRSLPLLEEVDDLYVAIVARAGLYVP